VSTTKTADCHRPPIYKGMFCILPVSVVAVTYSVSAFDVIQFLIPSNFEIERLFLFKILASVALSPYACACVCVHTCTCECLRVRAHVCVCVCTDTDEQKNQIPGKEHVFYVCCVLCLLGYHEDSFVMMPFPLCSQFAAGCRKLWRLCRIVTKPVLAEIT
jgi:hypothetical protein